MRTAISVVAKVFALTIIQFICFAVASGVVGLAGTSQTPEQGDTAARSLLAVCFLNSLVLTHLVLRSRWAGWRLMATVFLVFYGVMTLMSQIESAVFLTRLPPGTVPRLFLMGALIAAPFAVLSVLILGKRKGDVADTERNSRLVMPAKEWTWKLAVIAIAYPILYFTFGYYVLWRTPGVPAYYGGIDEGSFFARMSAVLADSFWLIPLQMLRAMLWVAIALPVVRMMKGRWHETAVALGLLFAVLMVAELLLPNPYMPDVVRMAHFREIAPSNFIFGCLVGWLLAHRHERTEIASAQD